MKKITTMILALVATMTATAQNLTVSGTLKGLADGTPLELRILSHDDDPAIGTATLQNGQFQIKATLSEPVLVGIRPDGNYSGLRMMAAPGDAITVNATLQERDNGNNIYYEAGDLQISGSSLQATYEEKMSGRTKLDQLRGEFERKWRPLHEKMSKMSKEEQDKVKEGDEYKQMLEEDRQFFRTVEEVYGKAITDNKDTFWGPLLMIMQTSFLTSDQIPQYEQFSEAAKNSFYGRKVKDEILPVGGVGSTLLDFTLHKEDGTPVKFDDLIKGKKYLYIDFWASWCAPCRKEIPNVKANYEKYKDKGFEVVGISIDTNKAAWQKACEKEQLQWPSFLDRDVANLFKVRAVPTIYIVDANGKIIAMNDEIRGEKLGEKLAELFK